MDKNYSLRIAEQFYSLQGEGKTMGVPAVFVRLQACNILCKGEWICDTIEVWKTGNKTTIHNWLYSIRFWIKNLKDGAHLIFTGGEPLLQQKQIINAVKIFKRLLGFKPFVEIETNGTIMPSEELLDTVDLFNCSFKLKNSGVRKDRRLKYDVLKKLNNYNTIYKIVISSTIDFIEAKEIFDEVGIKNKDVWLMPAGDNYDDIIKTNKIVANICIIYTMNFSTRLQVVLWNKTTGV